MSASLDLFLARSSLTAREMRVFHAYRSVARMGNLIDVSQTFIAELAGLTPAAVCRAHKKLRDLGLFVQVKDSVTGQLRWHINPSHSFNGGPRGQAAAVAAVGKVVRLRSVETVKSSASRLEL